MKYLRQAFAVLSWFLGFGAFMAVFRVPTEQAGGFVLIASVLILNGWLHWKASVRQRVTPHQDFRS